MTSDDGDGDPPGDDIDDGPSPTGGPDEETSPADDIDDPPADPVDGSGERGADAGEDPDDGSDDAGGGPGDDGQSDSDDGDDPPDGDGPGDRSPDGGETPPPGEPDTDASDVAISEDIEDLREELHDFREDVEGRTLHRDDVERDLRKYVRRRLRRGHARGWGPYVVLLYGTLMTVGGFYYLENLWAVLAMIVIWLSTLGLYVVMIVVGIGLEMLSLPTRAIERVRERRS